MTEPQMRLQGDRGAWRGSRERVGTHSSPGAAAVQRCLTQGRFRARRPGLTGNASRCCASWVSALLRVQGPSGTFFQACTCFPLLLITDRTAPRHLHQRFRLFNLNECIKKHSLYK